MKKRWIGLLAIVLLIGSAVYLATTKDDDGPRDDLKLAHAPLADPATLKPSSLPQMPPRNPMAADGINPMPHGEPAQQDSTLIAGPLDTTRQLSAEELTYVWLGPGYFGAYTSNPYENGSRVLWANGVNGLYKIDYDSYEILAHQPTPEAEEFTQEWAEDITKTLDDDNSIWALPTAIRAL